MSNKRGFHLIDLIVVMAILPVVMVITGKLFLTFSQQIPQSDRTINQHTTLHHILDQLEDDMHGATDVRIMNKKGVSHLIIQTPETSWQYHREGKNLLRSPIGQTDESQTWRLPQGIIHWELVTPQPNSQALLIKTSIHYIKGKHPFNKLSQSRLFFYSDKQTTEVQP